MGSPGKKVEGQQGGEVPLLLTCGGSHLIYHLYYDKKNNDFNTQGDRLLRTLQPALKGPALRTYQNKIVR